MDVFHKEKSELTEDQQSQIIAIKSAAENLYDVMQSIGQDYNGEQIARMILGKRRLEEAVMWAVKSITMPKE